LRVESRRGSTQQNIRCDGALVGAVNKDCFYNYSPSRTLDGHRTQVHAVVVSGDVIDRSKNNRSRSRDVSGSAAGTTAMVWPSRAAQKENVTRMASGSALMEGERKFAQICQSSLISTSTVPGRQE